MGWNNLVNLNDLIDSISVSRIPHPSARFTPGQKIKAVVKSVDAEGRITLSYKELLGTWEENAARFEPGQTAAGIIRSIEPYGIFVELAPNLAGLAELPDRRAPSLALSPGKSAAVYIKSTIPERMKVKLVLIDTYSSMPPTQPMRYFVDTAAVTHLDRWCYSPASAPRVIETVFA